MEEVTDAIEDIEESLVSDDTEDIEEELEQAKEEIAFLRLRRALMRDLLKRHGLLKQLPPANPPKHLRDRYA